MNTLKALEKRFRGWIPKKPIAAYATKPLKPRWKRPAWIALTLVAVVALSFFAYRGVQILIFYADPQADVTASHYGKALNCTSARVGEVVEVSIYVYWHGHVVPEFKRQVEIIDPYPESNFELISGDESSFGRLSHNNTLQYSGYGGMAQLMYQLKVIGNDIESVELSKPRLYLDGTEIQLYSESEL
jgi:hypothetical protein